MSTWAKIKFFYDSIPGLAGSLITATSATSNAPIENIYNMLETDLWQASDITDPHYITVDLQTHLGYPARGADYLAVLGHNLGSIGATVGLEYSTDNFAADINDAFTPVAVTSDTVFLKEFAATPGYRYWRLKITGHSSPPYLTLCIWGSATELDYATSSFDPNAELVKANMNITQGGYMAGAHTRYSERGFPITFHDADPALYAKVRAWWDAVGLKNFFVAWDTAASPADVYLMRPDARFRNPFKAGGLYRDITINLKGRKE
jgi:hypothetical protein